MLFMSPNQQWWNSAIFYTGSIQSETTGATQYQKHSLSHITAQKYKSDENEHTTECVKLSIEFTYSFY